MWLYLFWWTWSDVLTSQLKYLLLLNRTHVLGTVELVQWLFTINDVFYFLLSRSIKVLEVLVIVGKIWWLLVCSGRTLTLCPHWRSKLSACSHLFIHWCLFLFCPFHINTELNINIPKEGRDAVMLISQSYKLTNNMWLITDFLRWWSRYF